MFRQTLRLLSSVLEDDTDDDMDLAVFGELEVKVVRSGTGERCAKLKGAATPVTKTFCSSHKFKLQNPHIESVNLIFHPANT
jgi:hypothetical protein